MPVAARAPRTPVTEELVGGNVLRLLLKAKVFPREMEAELQGAIVDAEREAILLNQHLEAIRSFINEANVAFSPSLIFEEAVEFTAGSRLLYLARTPVTGSVQLIRNGFVLSILNGDFVIGGKVITVSDINTPQDGDFWAAWYRSAE